LSAAESMAIRVEDSSHVAAARSAVQKMARDLGYDETREGRAAIIASEAVSNIVKHASRGTFIASPLARPGAIGIEMLAIDGGPGMENFRASSRDGVSTAGTRGTGLGAIQRLASAFDVYTMRGHGTILRMVLWTRDDVPDADYDIGAVLVPKAGEEVCGDAWAVELQERGATFVVADGLGHGPDASRASTSAVDVLRRHPSDSAIRILDLAHAKLRATRGAAVAVIRHDRARGEVTFAGIGNIAAFLVEGGRRRAMVSHNGIVGHNASRALEFKYPWSRHAMLVAHSDGLQSQWDLEAHPGLGACHPSIIAAALYRDYSRGRDDVAVVVARDARGAA